MTLFSVHTVEFSALDPEHPEVLTYHHPEEVWDQLLDHMGVDFRDCPDVQELWLCTGEEDQVMIWGRL